MSRLKLVAVASYGVSHPIAPPPPGEPGVPVDCPVTFDAAEGFDYDAATGRVTLTIGVTPGLAHGASYQLPTAVEVRVYPDELPGGVQLEQLANFAAVAAARRSVATPGVLRLRVEDLPDGAYQFAILAEFPDPA